MKTLGWAIYADPTSFICSDVTIWEETAFFCRTMEECIRLGIRLLAQPRSLTITEKEWLTSDEAAAYLGITVRSLFNQTSNGKIHFYKFGRRLRFKLSDLRELLLAQPRGGLR